MKIWSWQYADKKFREAMLNKWFGHCEAIPCSGDCGWNMTRSHTDVAHWVSRRVKSLRWWPTNVLPLCRTCHEKSHAAGGRDLMFKWMQRTFGKTFYKALNEIRQSHTLEWKAIEQLMTWAK